MLEKKALPISLKTMIKSLQLNKCLCVLTCSKKQGKWYSQVRFSKVPDQSLTEILFKDGGLLG